LPNRSSVNGCRLPQWDPHFSKEGNQMRGKKSNGRLLFAKNLSDYAVYLIVRLAICIVQMFPLTACQS
jgi:hypothetical protein